MWDVGYGDLISVSLTYALGAGWVCYGYVHEDIYHCVKVQRGLEVSRLDIGVRYRVSVVEVRYYRESSRAIVSAKSA